MYSPNIDRVISSDQIRAFRFPIFSEFLLIFQGFADDSLCPVPGSRSWPPPVGRGRLGLPRGLRGGLAYLTSAREGGQDFGKDDELRLILAENYIRAATSQPQSAQSSQRTHKEIWGSLQHRHPCGAVGGSARLPLGGDCYHDRLPEGTFRSSNWKAWIHAESSSGQSI